MFNTPSRMIYSLALITGLLASSTPAAASESEAAKDAPIPDRAIERSITREIRHDRALPFDHIDVEVTRGVARLRGRVFNLLARDRAVKQAQAVRGVRAVVNELRVMPTRERTDAELAVDAARALKNDPATDAFEITPRVQDGAVTLVGSVDSWQERELAITVIKGIRGVKAVEADVTVVHGEPRLARTIEAEIEAALRWDVYIDDALIEVRVRDDVAHLEGTVGSAAEKWLAMAKARTHGIQRVEADKLEVARWAREDDLRRTKFIDVDDDAIHAALTRALRKDPRVSGYAIHTEVDDGLVTLRGVVNDLRARRAAVRDARNTVGVVGVLDHLKVRATEERPDKAIVTSIGHALARDPYAHRVPVQLRVDDGIVTLEGTADTWYAYQRIDQIVATATGVRDIRNRIRVLARHATFDPYVDDWEPTRPVHAATRVRGPDEDDRALVRKVHAELLWSPFVNAHLISVRAEDGVVTLTGSVSGLAERLRAREEAYEAGADLVHDKLKVRRLKVPPPIESAQ